MSAAMPSPAPGSAATGLAVRVLRALVRGYQLLFSAWVGGQCRFYPTCSAYAIQALERHGAAAGTYLAAHRLCRCHPWCDGGVDEVPMHPPRLFTLLHERRHAPVRPPTSASPEFQPAARADRKEAKR